MNPLLTEVYSIINGYSDAKDNERVFTFIEFVKQFGYENDSDVFISAYKDYVTQWSIVKKNSITESTEDFVTTRLIDVLKSITLDYSSYEEQDFISHVDLSNTQHLMGLCALYSRKIKQIAEYYRAKRNETSLIVKKNVQKGTLKSIQEIIYEKIFDYLFSDRNIVASYENIKRDLVVSVENYVDTYSDYFDIPREQKVDDDSRSKLLNQLLDELETQNAVNENDYVVIDDEEEEEEEDTEEVSPQSRMRMMRATRATSTDEPVEVEEDTSSSTVQTNTTSSSNNNTSSNNSNLGAIDVDYKVFLDDAQLMVSDLMFSGNVHLSELPLIAQVSVDLSQDCVGDMLALKEQILEGLKPEGVELTEKIELKKQIYEKFVGVDLWYAYVDPNGNVKVDLLFKPTNNTGNLLNGPSGDIAIIEPDDLTTLPSSRGEIIYGGSPSTTGGGASSTTGGGFGGGGNTLIGGIVPGTSLGDIITPAGGTSPGGSSGGSGKPTGPGVLPDGTIVGTITSGNGSSTTPSTGGSSGSSGSGGGGSTPSFGGSGYGSSTSTGGGSGYGGSAGGSGYGGSGGGGSTSGGSTSGGSGYGGSGYGGSTSSSSFGNILADKNLSKTNNKDTGYKGSTGVFPASYLSPGGGFGGRTGYQGYSDTGDGETQYLELLSRIGLFFKPDKTSILTVNSKECTWSLDTDALIPDTIYVFPDPNKYGDIGNNKNPLYPLIMEHRLNYEVKNISSGFAKDDPILHISNQGWYSYYSKQQDDFKIYDNRNYDYSLTSLVNKGIMTNYQTDVWGNEFGILKGYEIREEVDEDGKVKDIISTYPQYNELGMKNDTNEVDVTVEGKYILLNGGYFHDPFNISSNGSFNFKRKMIVIDKEDDKYILSGISINNNHFYHQPSTPIISYGDSFSDISTEEKIIDHYNVNVEKYEDAKADDVIVDNSELTTNVYSSYLTEAKTDDIKSEGGELWVKLLGKEPKKFEEVFPYDRFSGGVGENNKWFDGEKIINFSVVTQNLIIETDKNYYFIYYNYTGNDVDDIRETTEVYKISKEKIIDNGSVTPNVGDSESEGESEGEESKDAEPESGDVDAEGKDETKTENEGDIIDRSLTVIYSELLYNENDKCFYILLIEQLNVKSRHEGVTTDDQNWDCRTFLVPRIYKFDTSSYSMSEILYPYDCVLYNTFVENKYHEESNFGKRMYKKDDLSGEKPNLAAFAEILTSVYFENGYENLSNWEIPYTAGDVNLKDVTFSYNNSLQSYLIAYTLQDNNGTPFLYQHKFKLGDIDTFNDTMQSRVFSMVKNGDDYKWNDMLDATSINVIPSNTNSILKNTIWVQYIGEGDANTGLDYGVNSDVKINTLTETWQSEVWDWNELNYSLKQDGKVSGKLKWSSDKTYDIITGKNIFDVSVSNLTVIIGEDSYNIPSNESNEVTSFEIYRDVLGNIKGSKSIRFVMDGLTPKSPDNKRQMIVDLNIDVKGNANGTNVSVHAVAKDLETPNENLEDVKPEEYIDAKKHIKFRIASEIYEYDNITFEVDEKGERIPIKTLNPNIKTICSDFSCAIGSYADGAFTEINNKKFSQGTNYIRIQLKKLDLNDGSHIFYDADKDDVGDIIEFIIKMDIDGDEKLYSIVGKDKFDITLSNKTSVGSISVNDIEYTVGWLKVIFNLTMERQSCFYDSSITFNESDVPTIFELSNMTDFSNMFAHHKNEWNFVNEGNTPVDFIKGTNLSSMCYDSGCTIFKGKNTAAENCDCMMCMCPNLKEFTIEGISTKKRNGEVTETVSPYENVKTARHMFFNTSPYNSSFDVDMKSLTNATAMFYKRGNIRLNKYEFNTKRNPKIDEPIDFTSIEITLPALETAPMMFWNRPLTLDELTVIASSIKKITDLRNKLDSLISEDVKKIDSWEERIKQIAASIGDKPIFPSISIWVDEDSDAAKGYIQAIAENGWEVSTNLDFTGASNAIVADGDNYLIRAYEYGNRTLEPFICDEKLMSSALDNVNYLVDICKSVVNPIKCEDYEDWIKLCMMWSGVSIPSDNKERRKYGISQVLGTIESSNGYGVVSKATLFDGTPNKRYCDNSWFKGTIKDFRKNYNLYFKDIKI